MPLRSLAPALALAPMLALLPAPALAGALVLSVGRAIAETAALVFTSGYVDRMPTSLLDSGRSLSVHVLDLAMNVAGGDQNAYASATLLVLLLLAINGADPFVAVDANALIAGSFQPLGTRQNGCVRCGVGMCACGG